MDILALMRERAQDYDCPACGKALVGCRLSLLRDETPQYTVQVTCAACRVTFVVVLQVRQRREERRRARLRAGPPPAPPIGADELLDLHELLRDHDGSLPELFSRPAQRR